tara:strand:+ start:8193 stop:8819 length:627 start_codon:yes stop_codon:yes gene_type:complete
MRLLLSFKGMNKQDTLYNKGVKLLKENKLNEALTLFNELVLKEPTNADYWSERGVVYFHLKRRKESLADMDRAVELQPQKSYRYSSRAFIKGHFKDIEGAIADYEKAIELDPEDAIAHNNLGLLEEQLGYLLKAKKRFDRADKLGPQSQIDGRTDQSIQGEEIPARNIQKELDEEKKKQTLWSELKSLGTQEGRASFIRFLKSGFKNT